MIWNVVVDSSSKRILAVYGAQAYARAAKRFRVMGRNKSVSLVVDVFPKMPVPGQIYKGRTK